MNISNKSVGFSDGGTRKKRVYCKYAKFRRDFQNSCEAPGFCLQILRRWREDSLKEDVRFKIRSRLA